MGCVNGITFDKFPKQGYLGERVKVCFHFDTSQEIEGTIVRYDIEGPWETIIMLDTGRYVRASECQYSFL